MKIEIKIMQDCTEPKITIETDTMTEEIQRLMQKLSEEITPVII